MIIQCPAGEASQRETLQARHGPRRYLERPRVAELFERISTDKFNKAELLSETRFISSMKLPGNIPVLFNGIAGIGQKEHLSFKVFGDKGTLDLVN
jgi:hypothetical protein